MIDHLSWSSVALYSRCPADWYALYVERRPRKVSPALCIGSAVHGALAALRRGEKDVAVDAARLEFEKTLTGQDRSGEFPDTDPLLDLGNKFSSWSAVEDEALRLIPELAPIIDAEAAWDVAAVEQPLDFEGLFSVPFVGITDVMLRRGDALLIKDAKTSASNTLPDANTWRQLALYSMAAGTDLVGVDQIVKTKSVTVHPWTDQGYSGSITAALRDSVKAQVESVWAGIQRGDFPVGDPGMYGCAVEHPTVLYSVPELQVVA